MPKKTTTFETNLIQSTDNPDLFLGYVMGDGEPSYLPMGEDVFFFTDHDMDDAMVVQRGYGTPLRASVTVEIEEP